MMDSSIHCHGMIEIELTSDRTYENPLWDCELKAEFTGPQGQRLTLLGFWDGGTAWKLRFSPAQEGEWTWRTTCSVAADSGLHGRTGSISCIAYAGDNPVYRHGPLKVSSDGTFVEHADGTPFFWLADTAWNGVIRGGNENWRRYLATRADQRFTAIQFVATNWRGDERDECGEAACTETSPVQVNPAFFQRLDQRVGMINDHGLVAAPVALWSLLESDIGRKLPVEDAARLASYIVARYDAHQVLWLLGGDGNYQVMGVDRWKTIGRKVFSTGHGRLATLHPCGQNWVGEAFRDEAWYDVIGYQSGHGDSDEHVHWLVSGPPATKWKQTPTKPVINLEPNYEQARGYQHHTTFADYHVRRAAYWSLLVSPTAGVTYGHDAIWNWNAETGPSEGHGNWHDRRVPPWYTGVDTPGIRSMSRMRQLLGSLDWTSPRPAQHLLKNQPGDDDPKKFVACARNKEGTVVIYAPCGGSVTLVDGPRFDSVSRLIDPATGHAQPLELSEDGSVTLPDGSDWLVILE